MFSKTNLGTLIPFMNYPICFFMRLDKIGKKYWNLNLKILFLEGKQKRSCWK